MEKRLTTMAVIVTIVIVGGALAASAMIMPNSSITSNAKPNTAGIFGHVSFTLYGEDGNIRQYSQGDNIILNNGDDCILADLYQTAVGTCGVANPAKFKQIALGSSGTTAQETDAGVLTQLVAKTAGTVGTPSAASGTGGASVIVTKTFTDPGAATYREAALGNTDGDFLARSKFTTSATLTATDDLVVSWTITVDN